jgi:hypothetical protein
MSLTIHHNIFSLINTKLRRLIVTAGVIIGLLVVGALVFRASNRPAGLAHIPSQVQGVAAAQHLRFTIYPEGILPSTMKVRKGVISISIEDLAGANGGVLIDRIDDGTRATVGNIQRSERHWRGHALVDLSPGVYELRVAGKPTSPAKLTVEP